MAVAAPSLRIDLVLASDFAPNKSQAEGLRRSLDIEEDDLRGIEVQIADLQTRSVKLARSIAVKKALLSPIRQIPPEVLSLIFMHCLPSTSASTDPAVAPMLLCLVNKRWRRIAIGTPRLWSSLRLGGTAHTEITLDSSKIVDFCLVLSGAVPFDIHISPGAWNYETHARVHNILQCIIAEFHRCRSFIIEGRDGVWTHLFKKGAIVHALSLETLEIRSQAVAKPMKLGTVVSPRLASIVLINAPNVLRSLDLQSLTNLYVDGHSTALIPPAELIDILGTCSSLVVCDVRFPFPDPTSSHPPKSSASLPALRTLVLKCPHDQDITLFMRAIHVPGLVELCMSHDHIPRNGQPWKGIAELLANSRPSLKKLGMHNTGFFSEYVLQVFAGLEHLERLEVWAGVFGREFLPALTPGLSGSASCPNLIDLSIAAVDVDPDQILDFVQQRASRAGKPPAGGGTPLTRLMLDDDLCTPEKKGVYAALMWECANLREADVRYGGRARVRLTHSNAQGINVDDVDLI